MNFEVHSVSTALGVFLWFFCAGFGWGIGLALGGRLIAVFNRP
jgi:hypothetical protein